MEQELKSALIITATIFAVLLSFGLIAITAA
ncbi:TPA: YnhF family membrane protein [Vibrio vulnificus]|nr:YnhF family membrane protein [Vibrio vulnificus]HAS6350547.1 YnhF family membrane protein [Vibrio vulnificus]